MLCGTINIIWWLKNAWRVHDLLGVLQAYPKWPMKSPNFAASGHFYLFLVFFHVEFFLNTFLSILN